MYFLKKVNIPNGKVNVVIVDGRLEKLLHKKFNDLGIKVIWTEKHPDLYDAVSYHPDMFLCHVGDEKIVYAPNTHIKTLQQLEELGFKMICGRVYLKSSYPDCAAYNVAIIGRKAFHNTLCTDTIIKDLLISKDIKLIHVKQGYSKCSICILDEKTIITSDTGIMRACHQEGIDVLLIKPQKSIFLHDLSYGFIGGCCGLIDKRTLSITGSLKNLNSHQDIRSFLLNNQIKIVELSQRHVIDGGSILPLMQ